jgi:hypothetical protein
MGAPHARKQLFRRRVSTLLSRRLMGMEFEGY